MDFVLFLSLIVGLAILLVVILRRSRVGRRVSTRYSEEAFTQHLERVLRADGTADNSARQLLATVERLRVAGAQWPEIARKLNPDGNSRIDGMLSDLKGPHQFSPHVALNVIEAGCRHAMSRNERADRFDAFHAALRQSARIVSYGD